MGAIERLDFNHESVFEQADLPIARHNGALCLRGSRPVPIELGSQLGSFTCDVSNAEYHGFRDFLSHTGMLHLLRSPAHFLAYQTEPRETTATPNIGTALHSAWLEPQEYDKHYVTWTGGFRKGKAWDAFRLNHPDKIILSEAERVQIGGMVSALRDFRDFPLEKAFALGECEKSIFWVDNETGVPCRIRVDCLTQFVGFDLKSFDDVRPEAVLRQVLRMGYDVQAAMYLEGIKAFTGREVDFAFVFVEPKAPHGVWVYRVGQTILARGRKRFRQGLSAFARLRETGEFHGYQNAFSTLELAGWSLRELIADEDAE